MRVWIDLSNSPHVNLFASLVDDLTTDGWEVVLTARNHAQTVELAHAVWSDVRVIGDESPGGRIRKAAAIGGRALALRRYVREVKPDVALSHGSYAQVVAARLASVPAVTMMDYEYQPANHLSFRLAKVVIVPTFFPETALRRFGASPARVLTYDGFKEELYLAGFRPDSAVLDELGLSSESVIAVMRPPPEGALYHRSANARFDELLESARAREDVQVVLLPRLSDQATRYRTLRDVVVPARAINGCSLLAAADVTIGAGGTMNRESALLGTPTYTVFGGRMAAADIELIRRGLLRDLRRPEAEVAFQKKAAGPLVPGKLRREHIVDSVKQALAKAVT